MERDSGNSIPYVNVINAGNSSHKNKCRTLSTKVLALIQLLCAVLILIFGCTATGLSINTTPFFKVVVDIETTTSYYDSYSSYQQSYFIPPCCYGGTAIWGGIFLIVASAIGIAHVWHKRNKCMRVAFLVLAIIAAVVSAFICIIYGIWAGILGQHMHNESSYISSRYGSGNWHIVGQSLIDSTLALQICVCLLGAIEMVCFIVSSSFWCYNWCDCCGAKENPPPTAVQYVVSETAPTSIQASTTTMQVNKDNIGEKKNFGDDPPSYHET